MEARVGIEWTRALKAKHAEINRSIKLQEFRQALDFAREVGLHHLDKRSVLRVIMQ